MKKIPDYSKCTKDIDLYAFYPPSDGKYMNGTPMGDGTDFRVKERYQEYKDCGFNVLLLENEAPYRGEEWETSKAKEIMDIAHEIGLRVIVYDERIFHLAISTPYGLYGKVHKGTLLKDQDDVNALVAGYMKDYSLHPAYYGVYLMDEPNLALIPNVCQINKAIRTCCPKSFVHMCLMGGEASSNITRQIMDEYGVKDLCFDDYMWQYLETFENKRMNRMYFYKLEQLAQLCAQTDRKFASCTLQCFGGTFSGAYNGARGIGFDQQDEEKLRYQAYATMAFCPDKLMYFHYWASKYSGDVDSTSIMDAYGNKQLYNEVKELNQEIRALGKVLVNFKFKGVHFYMNDRTPYYYILTANDFTLQGVQVEVKENPAVLVSELYDKERDTTAYMLFNATQPQKRETANFAITFEGKENAIVYTRGIPTTVALKDGKMEVALPSTEGILVIPY